MTENQKTGIPCTVAILTHNSGETLRRALESVKDFDEIIVCDGASSDNTLEIARTYSARVLAQGTQHLDKEGRIIDFSGVRNQTLSAASYEWFFFLDADEYIGSKLVEEIKRKILERPAAYWVPRKYVYKSVVVDCSVTYPTQQMRFFHKLVVNKFIKNVHERIALKEDIIPQWLIQSMFVPVPNSTKELITKWRGYLVLERMNRKPISLVQWIHSVARDVGIAILYLLRFLRIIFLCRGTRLPASYEFARIWYQYALIKDALKMLKL